MDRIAITLTETGQLLRTLNKAADPAFDAGSETLHVLTLPLAVLDGVPQKYTKVVTGVAVEMLTAEKTAVDVLIESLLVLPDVSYGRGLSKTVTGTLSGAWSLDCSLGSDRLHDLGANVSSVTVTGKPNSDRTQHITMILQQAAAGGPFTLPASWAGVDGWLNDAGAPVMPTAASAYLVVTLLVNSVTFGSWKAVT